MEKKFAQYRYRVWLKQAEYDLAMAKISFEHQFYEWTCFQSEQSTEKAFKGVMVFCGYKPPKVHKLSVLHKIIKGLRPDIGKLNLRIETLQAFTFVSRYPFIIPGENVTPHDFITYDDAKECIEQAENVLLLLKSILDTNDQEKNYQAS